MGAAGEEGKGGARIFSGQKKERRLAPPLRVEVSELRLQKTADPPRPFQLRPVPQISAPGLRSRAFYSRLIFRRLPASRLRLLALASPSASQARALSASRAIPACAFLTSGASCLRFPLLTLLRLAPFPVFRRSAVRTVSRLWACRGFHLLASISRDRVSLSSHPAWYGRLLQSPARATCSVPREHSFPLSATLHIAFRRVGRPAGGFCLTGSSGYSSKIETVKSILYSVRGRISFLTLHQISKLLNQ